MINCIDDKKEATGSGRLQKSSQDVLDNKTQAEACEERGDFKIPEEVMEAALAELSFHDNESSTELNREIIHALFDLFRQVQQQTILQHRS